MNLNQKETVLTVLTVVAVMRRKKVLNNVKWIKSGSHLPKKDVLFA